MDYREYHLNHKEFIEAVLVFLVLDGIISYLFYRSFAAFAVGSLLIRRFLKAWKRKKCKDRKQKLEEQFLAAMQAVITSLTAGYSVETAFEDALGELRRIYRDDDMIIMEFQYIVSQLKMNRNLEELLIQLSVRSDIEDIRNFAEIFTVAKRTGGNLIAIIRNTVQSIGQKEETRKEIQATLASKKMEQRIMCMIPCLILCYIQTVSPGFMDPMYYNLPGILIMTVSLAVYAAAVVWGMKIVEIEV